MNPIHVHLILNHVPVLGTLFGLGLLCYAAVKSSDELTRLGFHVFILSAVTALPVFLSGQGAETLVQPILGMSEALVERHEEAAGLGAGLLVVLGLGSAWILARYPASQRLPSRAVFAGALFSLVCAGALGRAAALGGQLHHTEIQPDWKESAR